MLRRVLVTGGAGFIGSHLVEALVDRRLDVVVLDDLSTGSRDRVDPRADLVEGDVRDHTAVERALDGVEAVVHLAARVSIRDSVERFYDDVELNLLGTANVLRSVVARRSVRRFVLASSMAVYAPSHTADPIPESAPCRPISPYGTSKLAAEQLAEQVLGHAGIDVTALRYFNTYGPHQRFTPYVGVLTIFTTLLQAGEVPVVHGDGEQQRDFVHVDDIVSGTIAALEGPPGTYNLGTGRATTVNELGRLVAAEVAPGARLAHGPERPGEPRYAVADVSAARAALGYEPRHRLEDDLPAVVAAIARQADRGGSG